ncbi:hypothetical protein DCO58_07155 [Helicobacter saguini]|uniref:HP0268 domain-containing protein n=1 Tax=Helicobacter saguini TaxID=1548018 RepID=A0A347VN61_9HELI|nr:HP0268 family nuclease [Helicobacter saguini]MWV61889.1 hypothetical protein [Helicobacter saguini]MWV67436.1 hypothetical protein [Helicobacter saguini]MWV69789.1 hypothetical protein [Helicobacter saguini]MWV72994.1 hypothetical protein [Helicobacter saguini]TLD95626.1 hypothetical protein LS64_001875 [Helicobacter saguini]
MENKEIKLAKESLKDSKSESISLAKMGEIVDKGGKNGAFFYLSKDNQEKDLKKLESFFKARKRNIMLRELRYNMDTKDYIYELHVL